MRSHRSTAFLRFRSPVPLSLDSLTRDHSSFFKPLLAHSSPALSHSLSYLLGSCPPALFLRTLPSLRCMSAQLLPLALSNMDAAVQLSVTHPDESASSLSPPTHEAAFTPPVKQFPCRVCQKPFSSSSNRIRHERKQHSTATIAAKMACLFCDRACFGQRALQLHAQSCRGMPPVAITAAGEASLPGSAASDSAPALRRRIVQDSSSSGGPVVDRSIAPAAEEVHTLSDEESDSDSDPTFHSNPIPASDSCSSESGRSPTSTDQLKRSSPRPFITDAELDCISDGFLRWLEQGPETTVEQMVKGRRMTTEKQLAPIRLNLRFLLNTVNALVPRADANQPPVSLSSLVGVDSVKAVMSHLEQRGVGPARIYALSLLLKKVCVYLCSKQSSTSMLYISPQTLPSWQLIDSFCNHSSRKRKLRQRDRLVLHTSQTTMTSEELTVVVRGCLAVLDEVMKKTTVDDADGAFGMLKGDARRFTECFITVLFALLLAPRQQVLREMTMDSITQSGDGGNYVIRMSAEKTKVGHPVLLRVPDVLTGAVGFYFQHILPQGHTGHVFLQRGGEPRQDFSSATRAVTKQLIGRAVNAHQFRHCIATLFHGRKDASDMMMRQLGDTMNTSEKTLSQFYVHQHRLEAQERFQGMLMEQVRLT